MRLIDADAFKNWLCEKFKVEDSLIHMIQGFIAEQPTAFDLERAIEQINNAIEPTACYRHRFCENAECSIEIDCEKCIAQHIIQMLKSDANATNNKTEVSK